MKGKQEEKSRNTKGSFVFSEDDHDQKMAIYYRISRYDYCLISEFDFADLLYKDYRYRTNKYMK